MLTRVDSFFAFFNIDGPELKHGQKLVTAVGERANGMTHVKDYEALAALVLAAKPKRIFEIGTFLGVTSDFFLELLPESTVVSIAYQNKPRWRLFGKRFNNSGLSSEEIGSKVDPSRRSRFTQLYGDSHKLKADELIKEFGHFDMILVDGDHSRDGVHLDTILAQQIVTPTGIIAWHDANPRDKYMDVRHYLEDELPLQAVATSDDFIGGIAAWSQDIEGKLAS